jgi:predicted nucleic-acid-binding protein
MVAIDTNVLVRYYAKDSPVLEKQAQEILAQAEPRSLFLDRLVLAELAYVLKGVYNFAKSDIAEIFISLLADARFVIGDRELASETIALFEKGKPMSFEDCWLLALKKLHKVTNVATFDRQLKKRL